VKKTIIMLTLFVATGVGFAQQAAPGSKTATKFSSVYTDLKTQCRSALTKKEEKEAENLGQDIPMVCKGYGGYEIFLGSHGAMTQLQVRRKTGKEVNDVFAETMFIADPIYTRKVEWRLANGVPFAVIFRRDVNDEAADPAMQKKIGEVLRVRGLKDDRIDFEVDVKKFHNPNEEARGLADRAYASSK
jgi:hypothetical protein